MGTGGCGVIDWKLKSSGVQESKRADNTEAQSTQRFAEKRVDAAAGCEGVDWLPRSLRPGEAHWTQNTRSVAGAPRTARQKKPATPVGMTAKKNQEKPKSTAYTEKTKERKAERGDAEGAEKRCREWEGILQGCNLTGERGCARLFVVSPCSGFDAAGNSQEESHRPPDPFGRNTFQVDEAHHTHYRKN